MLNEYNNLSASPCFLAADWVLIERGWKMSFRVEWPLSWVIMRKRRTDMQDVTTADDGSVFTRLSRFDEGLGGRRRGWSEERGWDDRVVEWLTEGGRGGRCEGHWNNAGRGQICKADAVVASDFCCCLSCSLSGVGSPRTDLTVLYPLTRVFFCFHWLLIFVRVL